MNLAISERHDHNGPIRWSPDGAYVAIMLGKSDSNQLLQILTANKVERFEVTQAKRVADKVGRIEWSPNGSRILAAQFNIGRIDVFGVDDPEFEAEINEGMCGLKNAFWSPDSRYIITLCEFEIRLTIWDLNTRTARYIQYPKFTNRGHAFSPNGLHFAVIERQGNSEQVTDSIGIYSTLKWVLVQRIKVKHTLDIQDLKWSPDGQFLCVNDSALEYRFIIYNLRGDTLARFEAYQHALGIKSLGWGPKARFLAVGSFDQKLRLFNADSWRVISELKFPGKISGSDQKFQGTCAIQEVYEEDELKQDSMEIMGDVDSRQHQSRMRTTRIRRKVQSARIDRKTKMQKISRSYDKKEYKKTIYKMLPLPFKVPERKIQLTKQPNMGIGLLEWSSCGRFLAARNDHMPTAVWIWDIKTLKLRAIINHINPVKSFTWNPQFLQLAISCQNENLYIWSLRGACTVRLVTAQLNIRKMAWRPDGGALILADQKYFCAYYTSQQQQSQMI